MECACSRGRSSPRETMRAFDDLAHPDLSRKQRVLAVGAFDGVHRGHQRLLNHVCRIATEYGVESAIMTFEPVPAQVFRPEGRNDVRLSLRDERSRELAARCVDAAIVVTFDEEFRGMSALDFARDVLVDRLGVVALVASKTHTFGRNAEADVHRITELGMELGFEVHVLPPILVEGERINSTRIRRWLWSGDVQSAGRWLGRPYDLAGEVVPGRGLGTEIGFPTANIMPDHQKLVPGDGVYACAARVESEDGERRRWTPAAVSIGNTPTIGDDGRSIEAHIIDDDPPGLGRKSLRLLFLKRLRDQRKFEDTKALAAQIGRDVEAVRQTFEAQHDAVTKRRGWA